MCLMQADQMRRNLPEIELLPTSFAAAIAKLVLCPLAVFVGRAQRCNCYS